MDQGTDECITKLESLVMQLAQQLVSVSTTAVAKGVICRAVVETMARSGGSSVSDVRDFALRMAKNMEPEIGDGVRTILGEAPAGMGTVQ
ncbi:hypothetical protein [Methylobacterium flocculans]|uniref:hypothetical protein n=1 Tax=Methylobacterium flocculans TaxID=2984843 RepID=UPI0021F37990|nr:hypothetical protein [Methylobacterium sp. FF17]